MKNFLTALALVATATGAHAQFTVNGQGVVFDESSGTYLCSVPESVFGHNYRASITLDADSAWTHVVLDGREVKSGSTVTLKSVKAGHTYPLTASRGSTTVKASLTFTFLPVVAMRGDVNKTAYTVGRVDILQPDAPVMTLRANVRYRGSSTNYDGIKKRNYSVKFIDDRGEKLDISLFGLRSDNHWILDGGALDRLRVRNHVANSLWLDMATKPYYASLEPKARSGVRGQIVELLYNGNYVGIYNLSENMDRKQMRLMKWENTDDEEGIALTGKAVAHGMLWKASRRSNITLMGTTGPLPGTGSGEWGSFEVKYPKTRGQAPTLWQVLKDGVDFVATARDSVFKAQVEQRFDVPVLIDYYIFKEALMLFDNGGKNEFWACYDTQTNSGRKLTLAVWDLDTSLGQDWKTDFRPSRVGPEHSLRDNFANQDRVLDRLLRCNDFRQRMLQRYYELRRTLLSEESLTERFAQVVNRMMRSGATLRETARQVSDQGGTPLDFEGEWHYLQDWIARHMAYLDAHAFALTRGDVNMDGEVNTHDIAALTSIVAGTSPANPAADVNGDGEVNIADLAALIGNTRP